MATIESRKIRRRVHGVLTVALVVSVISNVAAAEPTVTGRAVAAWPPLALMLVVDVLGRAPTGGGWLARVQVAGAGGVASVAAVASFTHMQHVARAAGEGELVAWLFPLTVDGLAAVCSVALVQLNRQPPATHLEEPAAPNRTQNPSPVRPATAEPVPVGAGSLNGSEPVAWL